MFDFELTDVLGICYKFGNLIFTPHDNQLISSAGNMLSITNIKHGKSFIIDIGSLFPISYICISPNGNILICFDSSGMLYLINLINNKLVLTHNFMEPIKSAAFSTSGQVFCVAKHNILQFYDAPSSSHAFNPFVSNQNLICGEQAIRTITWHSSDKILAIGSEDNSVRIVDFRNEKAKLIANLSGNHDTIIDVFFPSESFDCVGISQNATVCFWECNINSKKTHFKFKKKEFLSQFKEENEDKSLLECCNYNRSKDILLLAFENNNFLILKMSEFMMIKSLKIFKNGLKSSSISSDGSLVCFASHHKGIGEIVVWDWQSEAIVLQRSYQDSNSQAVDISPDSRIIATGGNDCLVKLWNSYDHSCFAEFKEHKAPVTHIRFASNGKFLISCSLDGTIRAYDLFRFKNFRTFTTENVSKISCIDIDPTNEIVCAATEDKFEIYTFSIKTGNILEKYAGHDQKISGLKFFKNGSLIVSSSWDSTIKSWDVHSSKLEVNSYDCGNEKEISCMAMSLNEELLAFCTSNCQMTILNTESLQLLSLFDLKPFLLQHDQNIRPKISKNTLNVYITNICFSLDSSYLIICSNTDKIIIYSAINRSVIKKLQIRNCFNENIIDNSYFKSNNAILRNSLDPNYVQQRSSIPLPGMKKQDPSLRQSSDMVSSFDAVFDPSGRSLYVATSSGLYVFSKDAIYNANFMPKALDLDVTIERFNELKKNTDLELLKKAFIIAIKLNDLNSFEEICQEIGPKRINAIYHDLSEELIFEIFEILARAIKISTRIELYMKWLNGLLACHADFIIKVSRLKKSTFASHLIQVISEKNQNLKPIESDLLNRWRYLKNQRSLKMRSIDN